MSFNSTILAKIGGNLVIAQIKVTYKATAGMLRCPLCRNELESRAGWLECFECDFAYNEKQISELVNTPSWLNIPLWGT